MSLQLVFGEPTHGWMPVIVTVDDVSFSYVASDVPIDSVEHLVAVLWAVAQREGVFGAYWNQEPDIILMTFERDGDSVTFTLSGDDEALPLETTGTVSEILLPLWRTL